MDPTTRWDADEDSISESREVVEKFGPQKSRAKFSRSPNQINLHQSKDQSPQAFREAIQRRPLRQKTNQLQKLRLALK